MTRYLSIVAILSLSGCSTWLPRYSVGDARETGFYTSPQDGRYALLEYRIAHYLSFADDRPYRTICAAWLNMAPHDPASRPLPLQPDTEEALLARFPELSPLERCVREGVGYADGATGAPAAVFDVNEFECETAERCTGWAGYLADGRHGWRYYEMEYSKGEWRIRPKELDIVLTGEAA